jgi:hypothetical protein
VKHSYEFVYWSDAYLKKPATDSDEFKRTTDSPFFSEELESIRDRHI